VLAILAGFAPTLAEHRFFLSNRGAALA